MLWRRRKKTVKKTDMAMPVKQSSLFQRLEKRYMFDGAAIEAAEMAVDLSDGANEQEQQEVLSALNDNKHVTATNSLLDAIGQEQEGPIDYTQFSEVIIIDSRVQDPHELIASVPRDAAIEIIDSHDDGVNAIANILAKYDDLDAIHIVSHGNQGELYLGNSTLNGDSIANYQLELQQWGQALSTQGDILFYGCDVAEGELGNQFLNALSTATMADIAASTDTTSGDAAGGDWELETANNIETDEIINAPNYAHSLNISISNLDETHASTYNEGDAPLTIDSDITFSGGTDYNNGSLVITVDNFSEGDTLSLVSSDNPLNIDEVSFEGGDNGSVYMGLGETRERIGNYSYADGTLQIDFNDNLAANTDFELGNLTGWEVNESVTGLSASEKIDPGTSHSSIDSDIRGYTLENSLGSSLHSSGGSADTHNYISQQASIDSSVTYEGNHSLKLYLSGGVTQGYGTAHGPEVKSGSFAVNANDSVSFHYRAERGSDDYDVYAYLESADGSNRITILYDRGQSTNGWVEHSYQVSQADIDALGGNNVKFVFLNGTFDRSGGRAVGATMWIDSAVISSGEIDEGRTINDTVISNIAQQVQFSNNSNAMAGNDRNITFTATKSDSSTASDTITLGVTIINDEPTLTATGTNPTYTENASGVNLFSSADPSTIEGDQTFSSMTMTITNVTADDRITADGTTFNISNNGSATSANNNIDVNVSVSGDTATLTFTNIGLNNANMASFINGLQFSNVSENPEDASTRVVTITSLVDSGENTGDNDNTASVSISSTVTLDAVNDAPDISNSTDSTGENDTITIDVIANASDYEQDSLSLTAVSLSEGDQGEVTIVNNKVVYNPGTAYDWLKQGQNETVTINYTVSDGTASSSAEVSLTITGVNDAPVASNDRGQAVSEDSATRLNVLSNDSDVDRDATLSLTAASSDRGSVSFSPNGTIRFIPGSDFNFLNVGERATATITYRVADAEGGSDTGTATITVLGANDGPQVEGQLAPQKANVGQQTSIDIPMRLFSDVDNSLTVKNLSASGLPGELQLIDGKIVGQLNSNEHTGDHIITITVNDGQQTASFDFILTVIAKPDEVTQEDTSQQQRVTEAKTINSRNIDIQIKGLEARDARLQEAIDNADISRDVQVKQSSDNTNRDTTNETNINQANEKSTPDNQSYDSREVDTIYDQSLKTNQSENIVGEIAKNIINNAKQTDTEQSSNNLEKTAENLYERAMQQRDHTRYTDVVKEVVKTVVNEVQDDPEVFENFTDKVVKDTRLTDEQRIAIVERLAEAGNQQAAIEMAQKFLPNMDTDQGRETLSTKFSSLQVTSPEANTDNALENIPDSNSAENNEQQLDERKQRIETERIKQDLLNDNQVDDEA